MANKSSSGKRDIYGIGEKSGEMYDPPGHKKKSGFGQKNRV
jgi:hypothetical protein